MKDLFVDTNIVIDLLAKREPFYKEAQELFSLADTNADIRLYVSTLTFANAHYLLLKQYKLEDTQKILSKFKVLVKVLPFDDKILELALISDFKDFEDSIQYHSALIHNMDVIITRNEKDLKLSKLGVMNAKQYVNQCAEK
ncbi:twitching motility protein PilT [Bacteroidia bacterium]|nr:twitching motility protein PilT [Bacteroidia bacterium]